MTTIIGIDAATQPKKIGLARGMLTGDRVVIDHVVRGSEVSSPAGAIASWVRGPTLLAIDAPLGWPWPLGGALAAHRAGQEVGGDPHELFRRTTDRHVHATLGKLPLEVGADRIARTAHATLRLLGDVRRRVPAEIPLAWSVGQSGTTAIEVYPAATLIGRRISLTGYKKNDAVGLDARRAILAALARQWRLDVDAGSLTQSDDCLDAAVCVLAGADFLRGLCVEPGEADRERAEAEGWIWFRRPE